jgi:hypothetical protein
MFTPTFILCLPHLYLYVYHHLYLYVYPTFTFIFTTTFIFMFTPTFILCLPHLFLMFTPPLFYVYPTFIFMFTPHLSLFTPPLSLFTPPLSYVYPHLYFHIIEENKYKSLQCRNRENVMCNYRLPVGCKQCVLCTLQISRTISELPNPAYSCGRYRQATLQLFQKHLLLGVQGGRSTLSIAMKLRVDVFVTHRKRFRAVCAVLPPWPSCLFVTALDGTSSLTKSAATPWRVNKTVALLPQQRSAP